MSLLAWYPFNGDFENYGMNDNFQLNKVTNAPLPVFTEGKTGAKSADFSATYTSLICEDYNSLVELEKYSFTFWVKIFGKPNTHYTHTILSNGDYNQSSTFIVDLFYLNESGGTISSVSDTDICNGIRIPGTRVRLDSALEINQWYHFAVTYDGSRSHVYVNGVETNGTKTVNQPGGINPVTLGTTHFCIGSTVPEYSVGGFNLNGKLNDLRIYDECLSEKEVYEISKGLVVHYDFNKKFPGNDNLLKNSLNPKKDSSVWMGNVDNNNSFSEYCKTMYVNQNSEEMVDTYASAVHQKISNISIGDVLTISCWFYVEDKESFNHNTGLIMRFLGYDSSGTLKFTGDGRDLQILSPIKERTWTKFTQTFTVTETTAVNYYFNITIYGNGKFWYTEPKVEYGPDATPWAPHESEYSNLDIDFRFIEDSSGFGNHGTIASSRPIPKSNNNMKSPIGTSCAYLSTSTLTHQRALSNESQEWTVSAWVQLTDLIDNGTNNFSTLNNFNDGLFLSYYGSGISHLLLYLNSGTNDYYNYGNKKLEFNKWYLVTYVFKNSEGIKRIYIDGEDCTNYSGPNKTSTPRGIPESVSVFNNFKGYCADYKEYATALTPDDVRKEYQSKATLDSKYKLFANELCDFGKNIGEYTNYCVMNGVVGDGRFSNIKKTNIENYVSYTNNGLGHYGQANLIVTPEVGGTRIYSPPNIEHKSDGSNNTMWGGFCWSPMKNNINCIKQGHRYLLLFHVAGKSSRAMDEIIWSDQVGWGTSSTRPQPTTNYIKRHPENFEGEMDCIWDFTIEDDIYKTCTNAGSNTSFTTGEVYLSYAAFKLGYTYKNTGPLGTDIKISNLRLFDITDMDLSNILEIQENSTVNCLDLVEGHTNSYQTSDYTVLQMNEIMER